MHDYLVDCVLQLDFLKIPPWSDTGSVPKTGRVTQESARGFLFPESQ